MPRRRLTRIAAPLGLLLVLGAAAGTVAHEALAAPTPLAPLTAARSVVPPAPSTSTTDPSGGALLDNDAQAAPALEPVSLPTPTAEPKPYERSITVVTPEPEPAPAAGATGGGARRPSSSSGGSSGGGSAGGGGGLTVEQYCAGHYGATVSASGSPSSWLTAANAERAKFGLAPLGWSDSLTSLAQQWSDSMAANYDAGNPGAAMQHGMLPPAPGGQNVAVIWSQGGTVSQSQAVTNAHSGWMKSEGHCLNILRAGWKTMGGATSSANGGAAWYSTVNFGG